MAKEPEKTEKNWPFFYGPMPNRVFVDPRPSALCFRLLGLYSHHDRMSLTRRAGDGCYVSNKTLCDRLGCDYTTLIKLRSSLRDWGYITLEPRRGGKRLEVVRVIPDHLADPKCWPFDQCFIGFQALETWGITPSKVGEIAKVWAKKVAETPNFAPKIVGDTISETHENLPKTDTQYIPRRGETYLSEERKDNPLKWRDVAVARRPAGIICQLPDGFNDLPMGARVAKVEAAFGALDRDVDAIPADERKKVSDWLYSISDEFHDQPYGQQAQRLYEEIYTYD